MSDYEAFPLVKIVNIFPEKNLLFVQQMDGRIASFSVSGGVSGYKESGSLFSCWENMVRLVVGRTLFFVSH